MIILMGHLYMKMTNKLTKLLLGCVVMSAGPLLAQPSAPTATQQQQNFQQSMEQQRPLLSLKTGTNAPEIYQGENADVGPQHILRLIPQRTFFMVRADSLYLYSDNVLLTRHPTIPGTEFVNTIQAAFQPTAYKVGPGRFTPSVGYLSQWYNYEMGNHDLGAADFNVQTVFISAKYQFPRNWTAFAEFDFNRFLSQPHYQEFYREFVPSMGVQRLIRVTDNSLFAVGLQADYHSSWTANPPNNSQDRADGIFSVSYAYQFTPRFVVQPYYRFQYTYYRFATSPDMIHHASGRNDYLNSFGLSAAYYFTPNLSLRVFANDDIKDSDDSLAQQYHAYNFGAHLAYSIRF
jgi:hypothetical protein